MEHECIGRLTREDHHKAAHKEVIMDSSSEKVATTSSSLSMFSCDQCDYERPMDPELAGRKAKCPRCGHIGRIGGASRGPSSHDGHAAGAKANSEKAGQPAPADYALKEVDYAPAEAPAGGAASHGSTGTGQSGRREPTIRCPFCREEILTSARKCRYCGEYLDETLRQHMEQVKSERAHPEQHSTLATLPRPMLIGAAVIVVVALAITVWLVTRAANSQPAPAGAAAGGAEAAIPAFGPTFSAMRKALEGTEIRDTSGCVTRFLSGDDSERWASDVRKPTTPGSPAHASIELPYRLVSPQPRIPSSRGKLILDFVCQNGTWRFQTVARKASFVTTAGKEREVPEDDQQTVRLQDKDFVTKHIVSVAQKSSSSSDD